MAKFCTTITLILVALVLFADFELCKRESETWSGRCVNDYQCRDHCINNDRGNDGYCAGGYPWYRSCFCFFSC
ncbi:plant defensin 1.5 [Arabidopsis thaliana]|uniref:Plant defensin 1.5 n=1 Tax=Arabidopsis thaliana TaxID=3702 RepID=A0A1P8AQK7_ARATH|nr:plant defensin 1.5 [Arabidopsis thaliana]ANM58941.1 plant defensin 1.5 [Arabidopsis thaliana]|eukprot:NP_001321340.1 plant defensin 1.5 [Arabidopsis thaliana]